jgi:hypothetical protein
MPARVQEQLLKATFYYTAWGGEGKAVIHRIRVVMVIGIELSGGKELALQ